MHRVRAGLSHHPRSVSLKWIAMRLQMGTWTYVSKDVFHAGVEGMEQGGQFDFSRGRVAALGEKAVNAGQQTLQLFAFCRLLFAEFIPLGRVHSPCGGSG